MISPLEPGRRRRRVRAPLATLAAILAPVAVGVAAWSSIGDGDGAGGGSTGAPGLATASGPPPAPPASLAPLSPAAVSLEGVDAFGLVFKRPPRAGIVFDLATGEVLWRRHPVSQLPIASLTKIMTALLVTERSGPRERVKITRAALRYRGSAVGLLPKGRRVPIEALLHGLLLVSGNDAARALAEHVAGSERRFVRLMNERARRLGLACTRFVSSHGLEAGNRSCAADVAALTRLAMEEFRIARVARKSHAALRFPIKDRRLFLTSTNPLLRTRYRGAIGLKTGYTEEAGRCLVGVARRGGRTLGVVLLDSPDPLRQARKLLNWGFRFG